MSVGGATRRAGLLDLPDELILHIFDQPWVCTEDLYNVAQVSRHLHDLAISLCFKRFRIRKPERQTKIAVTDDLLRIDGLMILRLSLNVNSLERLTLKFPSCNNEMRSLIRCLHRATACVRRLQSVERVILSFNDSHCGCCTSEGTKTPLKPGLLQEWSSAMGGLMNTFLEKGCQRLLVKGGRYLTHIYSFRRMGPKSKRSQANLRLLSSIEAVKTFFTKPGSRPGSGRNPARGGREAEESDSDAVKPPQANKSETWAFSERPKHNAPVLLTDVTPAARRSVKLNSVNIQSVMFLMPPLLQWTVSAIHYSKIESLTLDHLSINHKCWPAVFELLAIASPGLSSLRLRNLRHIDPLDLLPFFGRFPQLTTLDISYDVSSVDGYNLGPFTDFPQLITLRAPAPWIYKLLSAQQHGLERLESLTIIYKLRNEGLGNWFKLSSPSIPTLLGEQSRPLMLTLEIRMGDSPAWQMFDHLKVETMQSPKPESLELVSSITLLVEQEFIQADMPLIAVLPRFLSMFPGLRLLTVLGRNKAIDKMDIFKELIRLVKAKKLAIDILVVNGRTAEFTPQNRDRSILSLLEAQQSEQREQVEEREGEEERDASQSETI